MICVVLSFSALAKTDNSIIPEMNNVYTLNFDGKINSIQKEKINQIKAHTPEKLRIMTFNMLYNVKSAEDLLPC